MGHFCPPGSGSGFRIRIRIHWPGLNPDPIWIRIRNPAWRRASSPGHRLTPTGTHGRDPTLTMVRKEPIYLFIHFLKILTNFLLYYIYILYDTSKLLCYPGSVVDRYHADVAPVPDPTFHFWGRSGYESVPKFYCWKMLENMNFFYILSHLFVVIGV